jgi:transcriptional regulator with XRE-family HTH domain
MKSKVLGQRAAGVARHRKAEPHYSLAAIRAALGKTQVEVAERAGMGQGDVSTLENRGDVKVSTLGRYAAALGGRVEVAIVIGGRRYVVEVGR